MRFKKFKITYSDNSETTIRALVLSQAVHLARVDKYPVDRFKHIAYITTEKGIKYRVDENFDTHKV